VSPRAFGLVNTGKTGSATTPHKHSHSHLPDLPDDPDTDEHPQLHHAVELPPDYAPPALGSQIFDSRDLGHATPPPRWRVIKYYDSRRALLWCMTDPNLMQTQSFFDLYRFWRAVPAAGSQRRLEL